MSLSTAQGQDFKGHVYVVAALATPVLHNMAPGWAQTALTSLALIVLAFISYRTTGNIRPEIADQITEHYENDGYVIGDKGKPARSLEEVLREGRE